MDDNIHEIQHTYFEGRGVRYHIHTSTIHALFHLLVTFLFYGGKGGHHGFNNNSYAFSKQAKK